MKVLTLFGTRPEVIKLAPVIDQLEASRLRFKTVNVSSGQHTTLLDSFVKSFNIRVDYDLEVMEAGQHPSGVAARVLSRLDPILVKEHPDLVIVQGDTTTAMAGALAAFHRKIPVGHVEAGLRSGDSQSPFPEEMNRRLVTQLASYHFAATARNRDALLNEGVAASAVFVTGNPVVDALQSILARPNANPRLHALLQATAGSRRIVLTTHRRESFGRYMTDALQVLRQFVESHRETTLLFPVHPNPVVVETARRTLGSHARIHLLDPLDYGDFVHLLSHAWLLVSDSGGVQEEAPTVGKPLLVLRSNTERPEAIETGVARLVGESPERLKWQLDEAWQEQSWVTDIQRIPNPFGRGDAGARIVRVIGEQITQPLARAAGAPVVFP